MDAAMTGPEAEPRTCAHCGTVAAADAVFCEACGADLPVLATVTAAGDPRPTAATSGSSAVTTPLRAVAAAHTAAAETAPLCPDPACGGPVDADGYCTVCGTLAPRPRDHMVEAPAGWIASESDRGRRHHRNEDAAALAADPAPGSWAALVVCDGVSTSESSHVASLAAARAARDVLVRERGAGLAQGSALQALSAGRLVAAGAAAARAVAAVTLAEHVDSPPSCTFVAALVDGHRVTVGNVGDSRAYWVPDGAEAQVLTGDDSVAADQVRAGVPRAQAEAGPQAHAITRWLGVDADDQVPTVTHLEVGAPGWLVLCSDGLWNYCSEASDLADLVRGAVASAGGDPAAACTSLVGWANEQGGKDNITVALARLGATTDEGEPA
ncbi:protein phosphatase 2C domain-containing protein [Cellulomonas soli]|uniref:protein phosphatase 2C domain-containing protein n=1 Tax=Cellulomonas soli TaxID=931535 RepID=UPI003F84929F